MKTEKKNLLALLFSVCKKTGSAFKKTSRLRLAKSKKAQCTEVHEHFLGEYNAEIGVFLEALLILIIQSNCSYSQQQNAPVITREDGEYYIIRVLTYNIIHGQATDGSINMDLFANIIKEQDPDLVALQEVDRNTDRSGNIDIVTELGKRTGLTGYFGKYRDYDGGEYGDGILSKFPVLEFKVEPAYFTSKGKKRAYSFVEVRIAEGTTIFFNCSHLTPYVKEEREIQARELVNYYKNNLKKAPLLICGDLNARPDSKLLQALYSGFSLSDSTWSNTFSTRKVLKSKIDYILHPDNSKWKVFETKRICRKDASDHCAFLAVLGFKKN